MSRGQRGTDLDDTLDQVDALYAQAQEAIGAYSPETAAGLLDRADAVLAASLGDDATPRARELRARILLTLSLIHISEPTRPY